MNFIFALLPLVQAEENTDYSISISKVNPRDELSFFLHSKEDDLYSPLEMNITVSPKEKSINNEQSDPTKLFGVVKCSEESQDVSKDPLYEWRKPPSCGEVVWDLTKKDMNPRFIPSGVYMTDEGLKYKHYYINT